MKIVIKILAVSIFIAIASGFYFRMNNELLLGDRIIGIAVLCSAFILMPIFLYVRWKGKKLSDYTLTKENMDRMKDNGLD